jgi:hypothetical protein
MTMSPTRPTESDDDRYAVIPPAATRRVKQVGGVLAGVAVLAAVIGAAFVVAVAAFAIAALVTVGIGLAWTIARALHKRRNGGGGDDAPPVLDARKGPRGWTVETAA